MSDKSWTPYAPLDAGPKAKFEAAVGDLREGLGLWRNWSYLAAESVRNNYRRTVLGPWWVTVQTGFFVTGIAIVFGQVNNQPLKTFLPYVAVGYITFGLATGLTRAGASVFVKNSETLKSTRQALSNLVLREVAFEFLNFAHAVVLYFVMVFARLVPLSPKMLIALPVLGLIAANGLLVGLWLGPTIARFRDVEPLVNAILGVAIFFSPIFYHPGTLSSGVRAAVLTLNPFSYVIGAFRAPLIGDPLSPSLYIGLAVVTAVNALLALVVFTATRSRLPYWVA
jgi:ABC-type polysaccharide/polyol phosphate export permease